MVGYRLTGKGQPRNGDLPNRAELAVVREIQLGHHCQLGASITLLVT